MYKVEWSVKMENLIGPYHDFVVEILHFVNEEPQFSVKTDADIDVIVKKIKELKKDKTCNYNFLDIATGTNLKKYICDLKYEGLDLLSKYNEFNINYKKFLSADWKDNTQYSKLLTKAFEYFYTDLIQGKIFNNTVGESNAIREFREELTLESTCPYCDSHEMEFDSSSVDHFIPKSRYPLMAIFPKNLIVACTACNERIKKEKLYLPIMHPYFDNLDDYFYFTYRNEVIEIEFYDYISIKDREKVKNFFKLFNLEKRYNKYAKKKLIKLKEEIRRNVIKQIKGVETISINEIQSKIKEELYDSYINISKYKKKDALTKLKLDYLKQMKKEDLSDLSMYIASENGENFLKIEDSFWV
ncbi:HNH endonuclease signature motif containing protein [Priestia aryabhattai]|uniref:HNH endonuclease n=1 Tax=Priestia aryabhattai TaxID=412384 RepID=UPI003D2BCB5D